MVVLGMRVAFAAGLAGMIGLIWIFWARKETKPLTTLVGPCQNCRTGPTLQSVQSGAEPHPDIHSDRLSCLLRRSDQGSFELRNVGLRGFPVGWPYQCLQPQALPFPAPLWHSAVFARIAIPEMLKIGYNKQFAAGVVAAGGTCIANPTIGHRDLCDYRRTGCGQTVGGFHPRRILALIYAFLIGGMALIGVLVRLWAASHGENGWCLLRTSNCVCCRDDHLLCLQSVRRRWARS